MSTKYIKNGPDNDPFETGGRVRTTIVESRRGCRLPNEKILKPYEGTISRQEFMRRVAA